MNCLKTSVFCTLLLLCMAQASAQNPQVLVHEPDVHKPHLFNDLPDSIEIDTQELERLFSLPNGASVIMPLTKNFKYYGSLVSKTTPLDGSSQSIIIRCSNRLGATLTLSRILENGATVAYRGRIISMKHADAFELVFNNNKYFLTKKELYDLYSE